MISKPYTKAELAAQAQLKGKELTVYIKQPATNQGAANVQP